MKDIYKTIQLGANYLKFLGNNPKSSFEEYILYLMNNKEILEEYKDNEDVNAFRIVDVNFLKVTKNTVTLPSSVLFRPDGMNQSDVLKVISYVYKNMVSVNNPKLISNLEIILITKFGFRSNNYLNQKNIVELFLTDDLLSFIYSKYYDRFFSWIDDTVTLDDVISIYKDIDPEISLRLKKSFAFKSYS